MRDGPQNCSISAQKAEAFIQDPSPHCGGLSQRHQLPAFPTCASSGPSGLPKLKRNPKGSQRALLEWGGSKCIRLAALGQGDVGRGATSVCVLADLTWAPVQVPPARCCSCSAGDLQQIPSPAPRPSTPISSRYQDFSVQAVTGVTRALRGV